jgi:steroid delta-isomerase-like uncharacterized protein
MSIEENKTAARRIPEAIFNRGDLAVADEVVATDYIEHFSLPSGFPSGRAGLKQFVQAIRAAFPDFHYTVDEVIAEGDKVVLRVTASGTQRGEFSGMPATGKSATWSEMHIARMANGQLVEHWAVQDQLGMLQQLGIIPAPGQA